MGSREGHGKVAGNTPTRQMACVWRILGNELILPPKDLISSFPKGSTLSLAYAQVGRCCLRTAYGKPTS